MSAWGEILAFPTGMLVLDEVTGVTRTLLMTLSPLLGGALCTPYAKSRLFSTTSS